jgi:hypothetical protein
MLDYMIIWMLDIKNVVKNSLRMGIDIRKISIVLWIFI